MSCIRVGGMEVESVSCIRVGGNGGGVSVMHKSGREWRRGQCHA